MMFDFDVDLESLFESRSEKDEELRYLNESFHDVRKKLEMSLDGVGGSRDVKDLVEVRWDCKEVK